MILETLKILSDNKNLDTEKVREVFKEITEGYIEDIQIAAFLTALKLKGETADEIAAAAEVMRTKCIRINLKSEKTLDIVGTGGDMRNTFNISTACAFVASAGGVPVAKHGNRALTSKSGSIDVLEALGINVNKTPEEEINIFNKLNICFMFAQNHHPAMKNVTKVRKSLPFRTIFNILGPLTNPAFASSMLFGVYDEKLVHLLCEAILKLGVQNVIVVHGHDGIDEASLIDYTVISEGRESKIKDYKITPEQFGLKRCTIADIAGGNAAENAQIIKDIFSLKENGAKRDIVILNTALAFYTYKKVNTIQEGIDYARYIINSKSALKKLEDYIKLSNEA